MEISWEDHVVEAKRIQVGRVVGIGTIPWYVWETPKGAVYRLSTAKTRLSADVSETHAVLTFWGKSFGVVVNHQGSTSTKTFDDLVRAARWAERKIAELVKDARDTPVEIYGKHIEWGVEDDSLRYT